MSEDKKSPVAEKAAPVAKQDGIQVEALHKGFYGNSRKNEGDKFFVQSADQLGSWMKCVDKGHQAKHEEAMAAKKAALKKVAGK